MLSDKWEARLQDVSWGVCLPYSLNTSVSCHVLYEKLVFLKGFWVRQLAKEIRFPDLSCADQTKVGNNVFDISLLVTALFASLLSDVFAKNDGLCFCLP